MLYLVYSLAVLFGFTRGTKEGMVMITNYDVMSEPPIPACAGVRAHKWFKYYHRISVLAFAFFALGYGMLIRMPFDLRVLMIVLFIVWETYELGYSFSRYRKFMPDSENLLLFRIRDGWVRKLHIMRLLVILVLLYMIGSM